MDDRRRLGSILEFVRSVTDENGPCDQTRLQRGAYLIQTLGGISLGYDFVLYKAGPFSPELEEDVAHLLTRNSLEWARTDGEGAGFILGEEAPSRDSSDRDAVIDAIGRWVSIHDCPLLDRIGSALIIEDKVLPKGSREERVEYLADFKSNYSEESLHEAFELLSRLRLSPPEEWPRRGQTPSRERASKATA